jgi:hypothetical protein
MAKYFTVFCDVTRAPFLLAVDVLSGHLAQKLTAGKIRTDITVWPWLMIDAQS